MKNLCPSKPFFLRIGEYLKFIVRNKKGIWLDRQAKNLFKTYDIAPTETKYILLHRQFCIRGKIVVFFAF